jgi:hypothetical protein
MPSIRIRVGASLDANALRAFEPLEKSGERARQNISRSFNAAGQAAGKSAKAPLTEWQKVEKELEKEANRLVKVQERAAKQASREFDKGEKDKTRSAEREAKRRDDIVRRSSEMAGRYAAQQAREEARAAQAAARAAAAAAKAVPWYAQKLGGPGGGAIGIGRRAGIRVGRGAAALYGYGGAAISGAMGLGMDVLQGMGVDTSISSMIGKSQEQQKVAQQISNAGYVPGTQLQSSKSILDGVRNVANDTGTDTGEALEALRRFVAKTGDLKTGQETLGDMAKLARATGTHLEDMASAAAEVTNNLGDMPDKAGTVKTIMQQIAGQGKLGAVEIRDLASQMAKLAVNARKFEGGAKANISELGILAQEAKLAGGATSATMAATSVAAFAGDISKKATLKAWTGAGLNPFTDKSRTQLRSPEELILEAVKYSKGDIPKLGNLFPNKMSTRAVAGFAGIYAETKGGETEKLGAVHAEFERLRQAQIDNTEVQRAFTESMKGSEAQVTVFNNHMVEVAEKLAGSVIPAFEGLAPMVVQTAGNFAGMIAQSTGQTRADALGNALEVGGAFSKEKERSERLKHQEFVFGGPGGGHMVTTYSQEEIAVMRAQGTKRSAAIGALPAEIERETSEAEAWERAAAVEKYSLAPGAGGRAKEYGEKAAELRAEAAKDTVELAKLTTEAAQSNVYLATIASEQASGFADVVTAVREGPKGGGGGDGGDGTEPGDSPWGP